MVPTTPLVDLRITEKTAFASGAPDSSSLFMADCKI